MKLTIVSQNLQGLNDLVKVDVVRNYFRPLISSVDIFCVQEHKLKEAMVVALKMQYGRGQLSMLKRQL